MVTFSGGVVNGVAEHGKEKMRWLRSFEFQNITFQGYDVIIKQR